MIRSFRLSILFLFAAASAFAQHAGYYNFPDVYGDTIVFVSEGDLWRVSTSGGVAARMTSDPGFEVQPQISPDGERIAFTAQYDGNMDVYVMPMAGGEPKRLTWHPFSDIPTAWTPDGKSILYQSSRRHPEGNRETFVIPADGGVPTQFPIGSSGYARLSADGKMVAFNRRVLQGRTWQRYGGGLADDVWIGNPETQDFKQLTKYFGNDLTPLFAGGRIFFTSERDGRMNLWSMTTAGKDLHQHTHFTEFDVRFPNTDGGNQVVFQNGADLYLYKIAEDNLARLDITLPTDRVNTRTRMPDAKKFVEDYTISNDGRKVLLSVRGDLYNIPVKTGRVIPVAQTQGIRETKATLAGKDEEFAIYYSDKSGDYELYKCDARTGENEEQITSSKDDGHHFLEPYFPIIVSPDGENIAWADQTGTLFTTGVTTHTLTLITQSKVAEITEYEWSPDSRHLAYAERMENDYRRIVVYTKETGKTVPVTDEMYDSFSPTWDPDGKFLFYLSGRTYERERGAFEEAVIMVDPIKIYALPLTMKVENPFRPQDPYEEDDAKKEKEEKDKTSAKSEKKESPKLDDKETTKPAPVVAKAKKPAAKEPKKKTTELDFEGIIGREIEFPMDAGEYSALTAAKDRIFFFDGEDETSLASYSYKKDKPKVELFAPKCGNYSISRNREHLVYRSGDSYRVAATSAPRADDDDPALNLSRVHLLVNPPAEWAQILREAYRYNRDYFYSADMAKVDWLTVYEKYRPLLERISERYELTDVIGNLIAELGHGHTYVFGDGDAPSGRIIATGLLGVDFDVSTSPSLVVLKKIYRGAAWSGELASPFNTREASNLKDGAVLLAVNGEKVTTEIDPLSHFWGLAGEEVLLKIADDTTTTTSHDYRVKLIKDESALRQYEWVKQNREYVTEKSKGEVGYVYLPDMLSDGLNAFFREFYPQIRKKAMVIDVRWNGGGNVSQLLISRLRNQLYALSETRNFEYAERYPARTLVGPMACLINEYAGSDGDIFPNTFRRFKLGPLIGKRTWGGIVGIRSHTNFVDGGGISVPEYAFVDLKKGLDIENYGVDPDEGFDVGISPADEVAGHDPQLDTAIDYLLKEMTKKKYQTPPVTRDTRDRSVKSFQQRSKDWLDKP